MSPMVYFLEKNNLLIIRKQTKSLKVSHLKPLRGRKEKKKNKKQFLFLLCAALKEGCLLWFRLCLSPFASAQPSVSVKVAGDLLTLGLGGLLLCGTLAKRLALSCCIPRPLPTIK